MEWIVILVIVLVIFGPSQLPKLLKTIGEGFRALKKGASGEEPDEVAAKKKGMDQAHR
jgi:sec-independent protein translocase protein TatA